MSSSLAVLLIIIFVLLATLGIVTAIESHPAPCRKLRNDVNSDMVRQALKRRNR